MCKLTDDLIPIDCTSLGAGGVSGNVYGVDFEDWKAATIVRDSDGTITSISLAAGARAVKYSLPRGASIPSTPLTVNAGGKSGFAHTLQMFLPEKTQARKKQIAGYANYSRMIWIVILDNEVVANVFGNDSGMSLSAYDELPNDPSKGGGIDTTWMTPSDVTFENLPPVTFGDGVRSTVIAALDALTVEAT